jgi:hypothetical protein
MVSQLFTKILAFTSVRLTTVCAAALLKPLVAQLVDTGSLRNANVHCRVNNSTCLIPPSEAVCQQAIEDTFRACKGTRRYSTVFTIPSHGSVGLILCWVHNVRIMRITVRTICNFKNARTWVTHEQLTSVLTNPPPTTCLQSHAHTHAHTQRPSLTHPPTHLPAHQVRTAVAAPHWLR